MRQYKYILLLLCVVFVGCTDDAEHDMRQVQFCVKAAWQNGRNGNQTRALSNTDLLAPGTSDITIGSQDYPQEINVHCSNGKDFQLQSLTRPACSQHNGFVNYSSNLSESEKYTIESIRAYHLSFTANATIDDGDVLAGEAGESTIVGEHLQFTLHHTKALIRFAFKVDPRYDKVRYIKITGIKLNDADCVLVDKVLNKDNMTYIAYAYVDPAVVTNTYTNTLECTYDIYDKDAIFDGTMADSELAQHITRPAVKARNQFQFNKLQDATHTPVTVLRAGYYYDLMITLNPDYLYVLSDHDNKHITIS